MSSSRTNRTSPPSPQGSRAPHGTLDSEVIVNAALADSSRAAHGGTRGGAASHGREEVPGMDARPRLGLRRVLDGAGTTLLELLHGDPDLVEEIGGVSIHDPLDEAVLPPN